MPGRTRTALGMSSIRAKVANRETRSCRRYVPSRNTPRSWRSKTSSLTENLFASLDDIYIVANPERVRPLLDALSAALREHARVQLPAGKTRVWNAAGSIADLTRDVSEPVWVGDCSLPPAQQGLLVLGAPLGHEAYIRERLRLKRAEHDTLLSRIPQPDSLQAAGCCFIFARCPALASFSGPSRPTSRKGSRVTTMMPLMPLHVALQSSSNSMPSNCLNTVCVLHVQIVPLRAGLPGVTPFPSSRLGLPGLLNACSVPSMAESPCPLPPLLTLYLGFAAPVWPTVLDVAAAPPREGGDDPGNALQGWQRRAARACDERACETHLSDLPPASRALLLSQAGPRSARAFTVSPTHECAYPVPSSVSFYSGGCAWPSHSLRDPAAVGAACATSGVLAARAAPLERAVACVCREGSAPVAMNVRVADMNIDVPVADDRRNEVVANGFPLWHGAQLALDATLVSLLTRVGEPHPRADVEPGHCIAAAARRKRQGTYPELQRARRCRLVVIGLEVGGRFGVEAATFLRLLARHRAATVPAHLRPAGRAAWISRWIALLAVAAQRSFASSLPELHELLADGRWERPVAASRLPAADSPPMTPDAVTFRLAENRCEEKYNHGHFHRYGAVSNCRPVAFPQKSKGACRVLE